MKKSQSMLEYSILIVIIVAAFLTMQIYIKRGFQGRWKQAVDDMGDQYDKQLFNSEVRYTLLSVSNSEIKVEDAVVNGVRGTMTVRSDASTMAETKTGTSNIGY